LAHLPGVPGLYVDFVPNFKLAPLSGFLLFRGVLGPLVSVELDLDHEHVAIGHSVGLGFYKRPLVFLLDPQPSVASRNVVKQLANLEVHLLDLQ
jgi:hypothetical protein